MTHYSDDNKKFSNRADRDAYLAETNLYDIRAWESKAWFGEIRAKTPEDAVRIILKKTEDQVFQVRMTCGKEKSEAHGMKFQTIVKRASLCF